MSEIKPTPGPWSVDGNVIRGDAKSNGSVSVACILDVAYPYGRWAGESAQANARLIAAAPELLEALQLLLEQDDNGEDEIWVRNKARDAIAKATGEQT